MLTSQKLSFLRKVPSAMWVLLALFVICVTFSAEFRGANNLLNISRQVSFSGLLALGMTLIIAAGGIDLSVGSLLALCGVLGVQVMQLFPEAGVGVRFAIFVVTALSVGLLGGAINGALVTFGKIPPFIATLGTFSIYRSIAIYSANAGLVSSNNALIAKLATAWGQTLPVLILFFFAIAADIVLRKTPFGWRVCAVGSNEKAARYAALNVRGLRFATYLIIGALAGISACLFTARLNSISSTGAGTSCELDAIACVIIGGTAMTGGRASIWGTLAGVFILGIIANILDLWSISANLQGTVKGLIILLAVVFQYKKGRLI